MSSKPLKLAAQRAFGTKVPSAMANSGGREDTVVLFGQEGFPGETGQGNPPNR